MRCVRYLQNTNLWIELSSRLILLLPLINDSVGCKNKLKQLCSTNFDLYQQALCGTQEAEMYEHTYVCLED